MKSLAIFIIRATQIASVVLSLSYFLFFFSYWKYIKNPLSSIEKIINSSDLWVSIFVLIGILVLVISMIRFAQTNRKQLDIFENDLFFYRFKWIKIKSLRIRRILGIFSMLFLLLYLIWSFSLIVVFFMDLGDLQDYNYEVGLGLLMILYFPFIINYLIYFLVKLFIWVKA